MVRECQIQRQLVKRLNGIWMSGTKHAPLDIDGFPKNWYRLGISMLHVENVGNIVEGERGSWMVRTEYATTLREDLPLQLFRLRIAVLGFENGCQIQRGTENQRMI